MKCYVCYLHKLNCQTENVLAWESRALLKLWSPLCLMFSNQNHKSIGFHRRKVFEVTAITKGLQCAWPRKMHGQ